LEETWSTSKQVTGCTPLPGGLIDRQNARKEQMMDLHRPQGATAQVTKDEQFQ
jgi:hypothetical protein